MEKLRFTLDEIPPDGLEFELAADPALYGVREMTVLNPPGVSGWVRLKKRHGGEIEVCGDVQATVELPCGRCLGPAGVAVGGPFSFTLLPQEEEAGNEEIELQGGALDVEFYDGETVDVQSIVAEQIFLSVPLRVVCREDCRGLCPTCGQDLNEADCGHREETIDPRWSSLAERRQRNQ